MPANLWRWLFPSDPSDSRGETEQELMKRVDDMHSASAQRDEYGKYVAKHAKPAKHWFRKGSK